MANVLVVEDDEYVSVMVVNMLEDLGHTVIGPAATVKDALEKIASEDFDLALLDLGLGNENSFPVARKLREQKIPYAFATGCVEITEFEFIYDPILLKPYSFSNLEETIALLKSRVVHYA